MGLEWLSIEKLQGHLWAKSDVLVISVLAQCCFCLCLEMVKEPSFCLAVSQSNTTFSDGDSL